MNNNFTVTEATSTNIVVGSEIIYVPFAISIFGLLGNLAAFLIIIFSELRKNFVCIYMLALLCSDSIFLANLFLQPFFRFDVWNFWTCAMVEYLFNAPIYVSSFAVISLTIERFFAIVFPLEHLKHSFGIRWKIMLAWLFPTIIVNFNVLFALKSTQNDEYAILVASSSAHNVQCDYDYETPSAYILFYWPRLFFTFILPAITVIIANTTIFVKLRTVNIIHYQTTSTEIKSNNLVLFVIPLLFVLLNLPYSVRSVLKFVLDSVSNDVLYQKYYALYASSFFIYCLNFALNFITYAFSSPLFRRQLIRIWYKLIKKNAGSKINDHINITRTIYGQTNNGVTLK